MSKILTPEQKARKAELARARRLAAKAASDKLIAMSDAEFKAATEDKKVDQRNAMREAAAKAVAARRLAKQEAKKQAAIDLIAKQEAEAAAWADAKLKEIEAQEAAEKEAAEKVALDLHRRAADESVAAPVEAKAERKTFSAALRADNKPKLTISGSSDGSLTMFVNGETWFGRMNPGEKCFAGDRLWTISTITSMTQGWRTDKAAE